MRYIKGQLLLLIPAFLLIACNGDDSTPSKETIEQLQLKKGPMIVCGPPDRSFGVLHFDIGVSRRVQNDFDTAVELLHSFEYDEAEKVFTKIIDQEPECAMAYWGVAMCNYHPLWSAPTQAELIKGS